MSLTEETRKLAEANALKFKDCGNGHIQIQGHGTLVNYWPESKNRTAHPNGKESVKHCSPWDAVKLCLLNGKTGIAPKKKRITKERPQINLDPVHTNPAGVRHLYDGKRPPWEYPTFISAHSDLVRIEAYKLKCLADQEDYLNAGS